MRFVIIPGHFAICKLAPNSPVPSGVETSPFYSVTRTHEELSIICPEDAVSEEVKAERGFRCLQVDELLDFEAIGVLHSFLAPLACAAIPIFAVSTYKTDFILIQQKHWEKALVALAQSGHELVA